MPFTSRGSMNGATENAAVTVTVTEVFVVRPLQLVRWRITQSNCCAYDAP